MTSTWVKGTNFYVRKKYWFSFLYSIKIKVTAIIFMYIPCIFLFIVHYLYQQMHMYLNILNYITGAQQAKICNISKNIKLKLWKTKAAIWFNRMCRTKQLSPKYIRIKGALVIKFYIYITALVKYVVNFFLLCCRCRKTN